MPFPSNTRPRVGSAIAFDDTRGAYPFPALYILTDIGYGNPPRFSVINCSTYATYQLPSPPFTTTTGSDRMDIAFAGVNYGTVAYGWVFAVNQDQKEEGFPLRRRDEEIYYYIYYYTNDIFISPAC